MAPLQKRALISLIGGLIPAIGLVVIFLTRDIATFDTDQNFRLIVYALWVAVPLIGLIAINITLRKQGNIDERDKLILAKSPRVQFLAILFSLMAWVIILTEVFWEQKQVPVIYLTLIMISTLTVSTLAQALGVLIGYWRGGNG